VRHGVGRPGGQLSVETVPDARTPGPGSAPREAPVLQARGLVRDYGPLRAVDGIDLTLGAGEFLTVFGPNGAGKSSLLGMLSGGLRPTAGEVRVRGEPLDHGALDWRHRIGVLSHQGFLYAHLTVEENLRFYGALFSLPDLRRRIPERLEAVGLAARGRTLVRELSHGMRQRLSLARTLLHDPDVILLDEPYTGLDPSASALLRSVLEQLRDGSRTVVMVTHNLHEGLEMATRVAIQVAGRFAWEAGRDDIDRTAFEHVYHSVVDRPA